MTWRSILPLVCLLLISCGKKNAVPADYLQPARMQLVLWDVIRADALTTQQKKTFASPEAEAENVQLQKQVFAIHGVTSEEFYKSLEYYKAHPILLKTLMDSIVIKANNERINNLPVNPAMAK